LDFGEDAVRPGSRSSAFEECAVEALDAASLDEWRQLGIVIVAGSFVSTYAPTCIAGGEGVAQAFADALFSGVDPTGERWPEWLRDDATLLPFEALMHCHPGGALLRAVLARLYDVNESNPVHRSLGRSLARGAIVGLITPNYDRGIEASLVGSPWVHVVTRERDVGRTTPNAGVCFKIHGTAQRDSADTLVYNLEGEGRLPDWKRTLLCRMVAQRVVVLIGYSGRDFDICPELAESAKPARVVWLQRTRDDLQPNAERVLRRQGGLLVLGDLLLLLRTLLDPAIDAARCASPRFDLAGLLAAEDLDKWRLGVLDWMACAAVGPRVIRTVEMAEAERRRVVRSMWGHSGRYRAAAVDAQAEAMLPCADESERLARLLGAAGAWFLHGSHWRAWRLLRQVERTATTAAVNDDVRVAIAETRMMMAMRVAQVAGWLNDSNRLRRGILAWLHRPLMPLYQSALALLGERGAWNRLEALQHNAERLGMSDRHSLPLPSRDGYRSLGLIAMDVISTRDRLRRAPWRLSAEKIAAARRCAEKAELYGWNHEAWKANWILICRGGRHLDWRCWSAFLRHFSRTEYALLARPFQLLLNVLPQRPTDPMTEV
jgi:hypothetical protein